MHKTLISLWIGGLLFFSFMPGTAQEGNKAYLRGAISLTPVPTIDNPPEQMVPGRIQSGIEVAVQVTIKNEGELPSQSGTLLVKYDFPFIEQSKPLFETEMLLLPSLKPGEEKVFKFAKQQRMPTIYDFVREDWGKREYQAIAQINDQSHTLGVLHLTFSAYYYDTPIPTPLAKVPSTH